MGSGTRREAILEAMIQVAGSRGYAAASVADVVTEAGASRTTFYKHFDDRRDCFLAAHDLAAERIIAAAREGCTPGRPWRDRAVGGLEGVVRLLDHHPALARTAITEVVAAGAEGRRHREAMLGKLSKLLEPGDESPRAAVLPPHTAVMAVGAVAGLILDWLQGNREGDLGSQLSELEFALLVPYLGPQIAAEVFAAS